MTRRHRSVGLSVRRLVLLASSVALAGATALPTSAVSAELPGVVTGHAFGAQVTSDVGSLSNEVRHIAPVSLGCRATTDTAKVNSTNFALGNGLLASGVMKNTVSGTKTVNRATVQDTSNIESLNVLAGLIGARRIRSVANAIATRNDISTDAGGSRFDNLVIAGNSIPDDVAPNTSVPLAGIGTVTVKHVYRPKNSTNVKAIAVEMLHVYVTEANDLQLPAGAEIIIGFAQAGYDRVPPTNITGGGADAITVADKNGNAVHLTAAGIPCDGTDGKPVVTKDDHLNIDNVARSGTVRSRAFGGDSQGEVIAKSASTLGTTKLLGGLIGARSIRAVAHDKLHGNHRISSTNGSGIEGLKVGGLPLGDITASNVRIDIPGIGYAIANESVIPDPLSEDPTQANGLHIYVTQGNNLHLPSGSEVFVAHASSVIGGKSGKKQNIASGN